MKIISWNINGYRSITGQNPSKRFDKITRDNKLFPYIEEEQPDIIALQETKANVDQIREDLVCPEGYHAYYHTCSKRKGYSGVVTFSKKEAKSFTKEIGVEEFDIEGRVAMLDFGDFLHLNIYFPKGEADSPRLDYKLRFYDSLFNFLEQYKNDGREIIVSGDYNTAHHEIDLARPKQNVGTSGFMPIEREKLDWIIELGYSDAYREVVKESDHYTWWSNRGRARENNVGWRIDYHFLTEGLKKCIKSSEQQDQQFGSDHCPVVLELDI